ncbi:MAG: hypothetical protein IOMNBAOH_00180 [Rhodocyclaceae bacterium]|nr:hypothetical protein [Rhodocyclaceae bacterium]
MGFMRTILALAVYWVANWAYATDVQVVGMFPGKAVLIIDGGAPRTLVAGGPRVAGVRVLSLEEGSALLEIDGQRRRVALGHGYSSAASGEGGGRVVTLSADGRGHFVTEGAINGTPVRFMVDTGATLIALGATDARRIGVDLSQAQQGIAQTANGMTPIWRVKLGTVKIGSVMLRDVDAAVHAGELPVALLGMSFLNRMDMRREGGTMTLRQRY